MTYKILNLNEIGDSRGYLVAVESNKNIPFEIKRVFYVYGSQENIVRGKHAHYTAEQLIICINGSCDFIVDDGNKCETIRMDNRTKALYIPAGVWDEFTNFSPNCVVVVFSNELYDPNDYISDYSEFLEYIKNGKK